MPWLVVDAVCAASRVAELEPAGCAVVLQPGEGGRVFEAGFEHGMARCDQVDCVPGRVLAVVRSGIAPEGFLHAQAMLGFAPHNVLLAGTRPRRAMARGRGKQS